MALQHDEEEVVIPVYGTLEPVYGEGSQLEEAQLRFDRLKAKFVELYEQEPELFARSPGNIFNSLLLSQFPPLSLGNLNKRLLFLETSSKLLFRID